MLSHEPSFNMLERIKIPQIMFSDQNGIQVGINSKISRMFWEIKNLGELRNTLPRNTLDQTKNHNGNYKIT